MTDGKITRTVSLVREWLYQDFAEFLEARMRVEGIRNDAELSRLSGVKQTQISNWKRGLARPSPELLDKVAAVLKVPSTVLYQLAGHLTEQDPVELDMHLVPAEFRDLIVLYGDERLDDQDRAQLRQAIGIFVAGFHARLAKRQPPPGTRNTRGRSAA